MKGEAPMSQRFLASLAGALALVAVPLLSSTIAAQQGGAAPAGPPAGRGAAPPVPANYGPYKRPASTFVPPKTADGQPDISGLYLAIPLPRGIETPLVPLTARGGNRAGGEYSYSLNERPKLPPGAEVRPAVVDPADGKIPLRPEALAKRKDIISKQEQIEHLDGR